MKAVSTLQKMFWRTQENGFEQLNSSLAAIIFFFSVKCEFAQLEFVEGNEYD